MERSWYQSTLYNRAFVVICLAASLWIVYLLHQRIPTDHSFPFTDGPGLYIMLLVTFFCVFPVLFYTLLTIMIIVIYIISCLTSLYNYLIKVCPLNSIKLIRDSHSSSNNPKVETLEDRKINSYYLHHGILPITDMSIVQVSRSLYYDEHDFRI